MADFDIATSGGDGLRYVGDQPQPQPTPEAMQAEALAEAARQHRQRGVENVMSAMRQPSAPEGPEPSFFDTVAQAATAGRAPQEPATAQAPMQAPPSGGGEEFRDIAAGGLGYGGQLNQARMIDGARVRKRSANAMHAPTAEYIETARHTNEARPDIERQMYAAEMGKAAADADGYALMAETKMDVADRAVARQARNDRRELAVEETMQRYQAGIDEATAKLKHTQAVDPSKAWSNRDAWGKARLVLAALGHGMAGGDPLDVWKAAVEDEVTAQRGAIEKAQTDVDAAAGSYQVAGKGMRDTFLALSQDQRAADSMTRIALYEGVAAKMEAAAADHGLTVQHAKYKKHFNNLQSTIADEKLRLAKMEASNPKYFHRTVQTMGPEEVRARRAIGAEMGKSGGDAVRQGVASHRDGIKAERETFAKAQSAAAVDRSGLTKDQRAEIRQYSNNADVAKMEGIVRSIDDVIGMDDVPGVGGVTTSWFGSGSRDYDRIVRNLTEAIGRAQSGGAISEDEEERFNDMITDGVASGGGEERLKSNMQAVKDLMEARLETARRGLSPEARDYITRTKNVDFAPEYQRGGAAARSEFE